MAGRQPPVSFKTVPNRNKTQKWQTAKTYNYDGDDWGGYDPYDEYGEEAPAPPPPLPQQQQSRFASYGGQPQGYGQLPRKNSFDNDDERRNFSAGPVMDGQDSRTNQNPARSNVSGGGDHNSDGRPRSRPRDFTNPEQVPSPLNTRGSPAPASFPPRKSSVSGGSPAPEAVPMPAMRKEEKELPTPPVVRPSDIYKRMEAEREKERRSQESSRPSMDSLQRETSRQGQDERSLSSVREDFGEPADRNRPPMLPSMRNVSGIGTSFLHKSESENTTPTRAPPGSDPAAEIMNERTPTRAQPGYDPAADILAERTPARAQPGSDPAADILAERGHGRGVDEPGSGVEHHFDNLQHQPSQSSQGYRSMVDQAFDDQGSSSLSRDSSVYSQSVGGNGPSRNNSNSTAGISPIMSRVPSAATTKMQQQQRDAQVPTIAEEPTQRKSMDHSRNISGASSDLVQPGYRRSLDPPSSDNSPARTPGLENAHSRRPSQPMSAETETAEPPAVADQGVEMMPALDYAETPAGETPFNKPLPSMGRSRAGTDYSMRESDMARDISTSPDGNQHSATIAQIAAAEQDAFLKDHTGTPTSPYPPTASGRSSPGKGRVRDLAGKYQTIEAESRRGSTTSSKSSWSNFRGSNEDLPSQGVKKRSTAERGFGAELNPSTSESRPAAQSQMSFRPGLPGQWVSYAPTPGETPGPVAEPETSRDLHDHGRLQAPQEEEAPDLTPTTRTHQLSGRSPTSPQQGTTLAQVKDAGAALGASLISSVGIGHQTRDFASKEPPAPVEQPSEHRQTGALGNYDAPARPGLERGDTNETTVTDIGSEASSVAPTPPAKDTPTGDARGGPGLLRMRGFPQDDTNRPISNYFSGTVAPLAPQKGRVPADTPAFGPTTAMSTDVKEHDTESDRLRKEIVQSLSPPSTANAEEDAMTTQDAIDAPDNMRQVDSGRQPSPPAEVTRPGFIQQRFSWEDRPDVRGALDSSPAAPKTQNYPIVREPSPDPEVRPEMPYERPRSRGLHIMNAEAEISSDEEPTTPQRSFMPGGSTSVVSPLTRSQEQFDSFDRPREISHDDGAPIGSGLEPTHSEDDSTTRVPSYYTQDASGIGMLHSPSLTQQEPEPDLTLTDPSATNDITTSPTIDTPTSAKDKHITGTSTTSGAKPKIPPFREILNVKSVDKRMELYTSTRQQFADTDTGLSDWVSMMMERHPEHAPGLGKAPTNAQLAGLKNSTGGHKHSPSIAKFTRQISSQIGVGESGGAIRRTSTNREAPASSSAGPSNSATTGAGAGGSGAGLEQRGKEMLKGASMFGGKAQAGAKGLLMKGRSRFGTKRESHSGSGGGDKAVPPPPASSLSHDTTTLPPSFSYPSDSTGILPASSLPSDETSNLPTASRTDRRLPPSNANANNTIIGSVFVPDASRTDSPAPSEPAAPSSTYSHSRSQSQVPSRTGSALSRTLSRLRERRSQSRSGQSRSQSRAPSLTLKTTRSGADTVGGVGGVSAPWDEPGTESGQEVTVPERLGVLPSPTVAGEGEFEASPTKTVRAGSLVGQIRGPEDDGVLTQDSRDTADPGANSDSIPFTSAAPQPAALPPLETYENLQREWGPDSDSEPGNSPVLTRPAYERQESDRAFLPSQQRSVSTPQLPRSPAISRLAETAKREEEDDMYESTPRQMHFTGWPVGGEDQTPVPTKDDKTYEDLGNVQDASIGPTVQAEDREQPSPPRPREDSALDMARLVDAEPEEPLTAVREGAMPLPGTQASSDYDKKSASSDSAKADLRAPSPVHDWEQEEADKFEDAREGQEPDRTPSRRSSVSSLGQGAAGEVMSSQAVPAGPVTAVPPQQDLDAETQRQRFMNRSYRFRDPANADRSMSYMPLGTTASGMPIQESLNELARPQTASVDISGISGPPVGVQPYLQHPAMRVAASGLEGDHGGLRSPGPAPDRSRVAMVQNRQVSSETRSGGSKRLSSFFKSRQPSQPSSTVYGPAPSAISDQYGLENVATNASAPRPETPQAAANNQIKRRSGIWSSIKRNSMVGPSDSRQSSVLALPSRTDVSALSPQSTMQQSATQQSATQQPMPQESAMQQTWEAPPRANTLKKPQRATTNATPPAEPKKKRFSRLGSLFGRSSTTAGHKTESPRKLMKSQAQSREALSSQVPATSSVATGYEAFEAARRRERHPQQQMRPRSPKIGNPRQENMDLHSAAMSFPDTNQAPANGWYGPPQQQPPPQQFRTMHSERSRDDAALGDIPEAYRPVGSSYNRPVKPIEPPFLPHEQIAPPIYTAPPAPVTAGHPERNEFPITPPDNPQSPQWGQRHASYGSNELSPQVSGQSEYQRAQWYPQGPSPSVSPVHSRAGSESMSQGRQVRLGSIGQEMSRGPPHHYDDRQQDPWAVNMPPPDGNGTRTNMAGPSYVYQDRDPEGGYPYGGGAYPYYQQPQMHVSKRGQVYQPSAPYAPGSEPYYAGEAYPESPPRAPQQRYYSHPGLGRGQVPMQQSAPQNMRYVSGPPMHQRTPSGYTGRRDEPAFGEDALDMKGSSYPGQEWQPGRWD